MRYKPALFTLALLILLGSALLARQPVQAQAGSAPDLIAEVNALRASKGLPPLQVDSALMAAAQAHADYQAAIDSITHSGPGGSLPRDRAVAAGFGSGATVFVAENIAVGRDLSISSVVHTTWADSLHQTTMLSPQNTHAGAGVATANGEVYYTLDVGYMAGAPIEAAAQTGRSTISPTSAAPAATEAPDSSIQTATPQADGSIVHEIQLGQALWSIAIAYGTTIEEINRANGLPLNAILYPGQTLIMAPSSTPTTPPTETATLPPPTRTPMPTRTLRPPTLTPTLAPSATLTPRPLLPQLPDLQGENRRNLGIGMILLCVVGIVVVVVNSIRNK